MPIAARSRLLITVLAAASLAAAWSCEHEHYWRGGRPRAVANNSVPEPPADPLTSSHELSAKLASMAPPAPAPGEQTIEQSLARSAGCMSCHGKTDDPDMHGGSDVAVGCIDCHGGNGAVRSPRGEPGRPGRPGTPIEDAAYLAAMRAAHVLPLNPVAWYGRGVQLIDGRSFGEHVEADPERLHGSRNPEITYALLNQESPEFVRFINPGDLRIADLACGSCHMEEVVKVRSSMMTHGAQLWGAALYNNGSYPSKTPRFGESYDLLGGPQRLQGVTEKFDEKSLEYSVRNPTDAEIAKEGVLPFLDPLPVWNITQPGNILRVFERGQRSPLPGGNAFNEIANPNPGVEPGKPDKNLSVRGLGTGLRVDPVFIGLQKTRLLDPILSFLGTNDHPGDFRSSGCTACHVVYANDRDPAHSGAAYAKYGNLGRSISDDPTLPRDEPGHPLRHVMTSGIPNSNCIVCHIHPGTLYANTYLGYMWWDNESDAEFFFPDRSHRPTADQEWRSQRHNPEASSMKGLWGNLYPDAVSHAGEVSGPDFLERSGAPRTGRPAADPAAAINDRARHNQFSDFHGHGWIFRAVFKKDRAGNLLTGDGSRIDPDDPSKFDKAVHLKDIHLERGMHCVDCHFKQDVHGTGKLYGEARNAIEITCTDCHGTYTAYATLKTSGPAAQGGGRDLGKDTVGAGENVKKRFAWKDTESGRVLVQRSALDPEVEWAVVQTLDTINPDSGWARAHPDSARQSRYAKTVRRSRTASGGLAWGDLPAGPAAAADLAHAESDMQCYTCHTSWMTSCFGCHLPMKANQRTPMLHNESVYTRNYTQYNYQVLRDDVYMLGRDSTVKGAKIVPVRSSSAVLVSSQNAAREWIYHQQQTVSAEGYSGQTFNPHFPHAVSGPGTTKNCTDCHLSPANDNNAWMAQLLLQGTNFVNFFGRYAYVAEGAAGLEAVAVTEHDEPQAVYGSRLHELAYPDEAARFVASGRRLEEAHHHDAGAFFEGNEILDLQLRGEYLYAARGKGGFHIYDVANIDNKGYSERIVSSPVSPLGQNLGFDTSYAVAVASPSTLAVDPARTRLSTDPSKPRAIMLDPPQPWHANQEQAIHPLYAYLYIADRDEGLILTFVATLLDGDPTNNFLERAVLADGSTAFNPKGLLAGMSHLALAGHHLYATSASGLTVIDIDTPTDPKVVAHIGTDFFSSPRAVAIQFRYAFVTDAEGLKVLDVTNPAAPRPLPDATLRIPDAGRVYVARTYAFVAAGPSGLVICDATNPEKPAILRALGKEVGLTDCRDVKVGMTNASLYAYVADGDAGLKVLQLMGPDSTPQFRGFAPPLQPRLIASYRTHGPALAISKALDRDRAVDESGHQIAVFGRLGARPLNLAEQQRLYLRNGVPWTAPDTPNPADASPFTFKVAEPKKEEGGRRRGRGD
ncbi:MAG: hypothetical protein JNM07_01015 [Phycisphaerae bacterium]|nr:hypothetical protein [Phycisphaerae bacterium]